MASITWSSSLSASPYVTLTVTQSSQSVVNNRSTISYSLVIHRPSVIYSSASKAWSVTINGVKTSGTTTIGGSGNKTIKTGTMNIAHNSDGTKSISIAFSCVLDITWSGTHLGTASKSGTMALSTIPRASSFSVANGTLGTAQSIAISRASSAFTHTITYTCGSASGTIATKTTATSVSWTPPIGLSSQNTTGTKVTATMRVITYSGNTNIGTASKTVTYTMPASVKPTVSFTVSDANGYYGIFPAYIQGKSKVKAVITAGTSYGSAIASYKLTSNDIGTYTGTSNTITTGILQTSGTITIDIQVTDKRGRTATASRNISCLMYNEPDIETFAVHRCDYDGTVNNKGAYCKLDYKFNLTSLNNYNPATYQYTYKKTTESSPTTKSIALVSSGVEKYTQSGSVIFACDVNNSYNIGISAKDYFSTFEKTTSLSTAFTPMNFSAGGTGVAFGGVSTAENTFQVYQPFQTLGGITGMIIPDNTDLDDIKTSGFYKSYGGYTYGNNPISSQGTFSLEVVECGNSGQLFQRYNYTQKLLPMTLIRFYYGGEWGSWLRSDGVATAWQNLTLTSNFQVYGGDSTHALRCKCIGDLVYIQGQLAPKTTIAGSTTQVQITTLPVGFRPNVPCYFVQQGSNWAQWTLGIGTAGEVYFARHRAGAEFTQVTTANWLPVFACFPRS